MEPSASRPISQAVFHLNGQNIAYRGDIQAVVERALIWFAAMRPQPIRAYFI
jgi:hypothetical protein